MAIKGNGYQKTTWAFQERPVASLKLNNWDDRIEAALELAYFLLNQAWGGGNGVVRGATTDDLRVSPSNPVSLSVVIAPGYAFISHAPYKLAVTTTTAQFAPPAVHPRIDLIQATLDGWAISIKPGHEAASPVAPGIDADCVALAQLYLRPGMTVVKESDDAVNGYIIDARSFV